MKKCKAIRDSILKDYPEYEYYIMDCQSHCDYMSKPRKIYLNEQEFNNCTHVILFDILHEIGHAKTNRVGQTRCLREYNASKWAIEHCKEYGVRLPEWRRKNFQEDIYKWKKKEKEVMKLWTEYPRKRFPSDKDLVLEWSDMP